MAGSHEDDLLGDGGKGGRGGGVLGDMMKKALFATIGAAFMTEETVRAYVSESKLPRDIRNYIVQNSAQAKEQMFAYVAKEISQLVRKSDLPKALKGFLADHTIEVEAKIRFKSNGVPEISSGMKATPTEPRDPTPPPFFPEGDAAVGGTE
jgi:hypothetical protein